MARRNERAARIASRAVQIGFLLGILALWYLATNRWGVNRLLLPNPVAVWQQLSMFCAAANICPICASP